MMCVKFYVGRNYTHRLVTIIMTNLFIFNTDFRVRDNPALFYAAENGESVVAMFIHNPKKWESHNESDLKIAFQIDNLKIISKRLDELNISFKSHSC